VEQVLCLRLVVFKEGDDVMIEVLKMIADSSRANRTDRKDYKKVGLTPPAWFCRVLSIVVL